MEVKHIIVIGASAGGIGTACKLLSTFEKELNAAVLVVIHLSKRSQSTVIVDYFNKHSTLECRVAEDGMQLENAIVYLAPEDHHLLIEKGVMQVRRGAYENHYRPSIDVLFRSAAAAYSSCVTGIILTGLLDDGASGMSAIKRSGGICLVQDPDEAQFPAMPSSVLSNLKADYIVPVDEMAAILRERLSAGCTPAKPPADVLLEAEITRRMSSELEEVSKLGEMTPFTCPDCGGVLTQVEQNPVNRFRCYTGHSFTADSLLEEQVKKTEEALWVAIRMMEERKNLLKSMNASETGREKNNGRTERWTALETHIGQLKKMLMEIGLTNREGDLS
jgi:two-component system chemotaxis response regulator CheB